MNFILEAFKSCREGVKVSAFSGLIFCTLLRVLMQEFSIVDLIYDCGLVCGIMLFLSTFYGNLSSQWRGAVVLDVVVVLLCVGEISLPDPLHKGWHLVTLLLQVFLYGIWMTRRYVRYFGSDDRINFSYKGYEIATLLSHILVISYYLMLLCLIISLLSKDIISPFLEYLSLTLAGLFFFFLIFRKRYISFMSILVEEKVIEPETAVQKETVARKEDSDDAMEMLYVRFCRLMEERRPFLSDSCLIEDVARDLFTNKTYLSKMVNMCTGQSFPKLINRYRVEYSMELYKEDMHLKVSELAEKSGFHSTVTYNMAFKGFFNQTPSEWCRDYRESHI